MFGAACAGVTEVVWGAETCPADKVFWTIIVPWEQFLAEGWTAPGGNKYWSRTIPANSSDPITTSIFRLMAARSRTQFENKFRKSQQLMRDVLQQNAGMFATSFGMLTVGTMPDPNETAEAFWKRGGYLLWVDPKNGPFSGKLLQSYWREWMTKKVESGQLWAAYNPTDNGITYTIRLVYKDGVDKVVRAITDGINSAKQNFCAKATSGEAALAAGAVVSIPGAQPYVAAWGSAAALCNWPSTPCTPAPSDPNQKKPVFIGPLITTPLQNVFTLPTTWVPSRPGVASTAGQYVGTSSTFVQQRPPITTPPAPEDDRDVAVDRGTGDEASQLWYQSPTTKAAASVGVVALLGGLLAGLFLKR